MSDDVLDLCPRIQGKRGVNCEHLCVLIGTDEPSAICDDCGAELDPWWLLRRAVTESAKGHELIIRMNAKIDRLNGEIAELTERRDRLMSVKPT